MPVHVDRSKTWSITREFPEAERVHSVGHVASGTNMHSRDPRRRKSTYCRQLIGTRYGGLEGNCGSTQRSTGTALDYFRANEHGQVRRCSGRRFTMCTSMRHGVRNISRPAELQDGYMGSRGAPRSRACRRRRARREEKVEMITRCGAVIPTAKDPALNREGPPKGSEPSPPHNPLRASKDQDKMARTVNFVL